MEEKVESLIEMLEQYVDEKEEGSHDPFGDDWIVDGLCEVRELIGVDGTEEGRRYIQHIVVTDKPVKLYEELEITRTMSGTTGTLKVMEIQEVRMSNEGLLIVTVLGV